MKKEYNKNWKSTYSKSLNKEELPMSEEVLKLQMLPIQVEETDEVDGMRFSTFSNHRCGNWSALSWERC